MQHLDSCVYPWKSAGPLPPLKASLSYLCCTLPHLKSTVGMFVVCFNLVTVDWWKNFVLNYFYAFLYVNIYSTVTIFFAIFLLQTYAKHSIQH